MQFFDRDEEIKMKKLPCPKCGWEGISEDSEERHFITVYGSMYFWFTSETSVKPVNGGDDEFEQDNDQKVSVLCGSCEHRFEGVLAV